jgi:TIR domain-containing protein/Sel1 repeat-containing protein
MAHDVFISHSSKDKAAADAVCAILEQRKIRCWIAPRDITPGKEWGEAIIDAISASRMMILIFSANANDSPQIRREVERAVNKEVVIVPLRIEDVAPTKSLEYFIGSVHWLDALSLPLDNHLEKLAGVVEGALGGDSSVNPKQSATPFQRPAPLAGILGESVPPQRDIAAPRSDQTRKSVRFFFALGATCALGIVMIVLFFSHKHFVAARAAKVYDQGLASYKSGDLHRAADLYQQACDAGEPKACAALGALHASGSGVAKDLTHAADLLKRACDAGNASGCENLGSMYANGEGVTKDLSRAVDLFQRACDGGSATGCANLAMSYERGEGVAAPDLTRAAGLFLRACDGGDATGCIGLGKLFERGQGVPKNLSRAADLYKQACDAKYDAGCTNLTRLKGPPHP